MWPDCSLRELIAAAKAAETRRWDPFADLLALNATIHTSGNYRREHFHPMRESKHPVMHLDDPGAEYDRLMEEGE